MPSAVLGLGFPSIVCVRFVLMECVLPFVIVHVTCRPSNRYMGALRIAGCSACVYFVVHILHGTARYEVYALFGLHPTGVLRVSHWKMR